MPADVRLLIAPFDPGTELSAFAAAHRRSGGVASFIGQVREGPNAEGPDVEALELSHYAPLTLPAMEAWRLMRWGAGHWMAC